MSQATIGIDTIPISLIDEKSKYKSLAIFENSGSKNIEELKGFFGVLGIAVVVNDYQEFKQQYKTAIEKSFNENGYEQLDLSKKLIYCSKDFREFTEGEDSLHESFMKQIKKSIYKINVIFSSFSTEKIPEVKILGRTRHTKFVHPKVLTLKYLYNSFPHICIWKLKNYIKDVNAKILVDHFDGKRTHAWESIESDKLDINVFFKGDQCNYLISTADILLKCLQNRIEQTKSQYDYEGILNNLSDITIENLHIHNINARHYTYITPRDERNIPLRKYIKRPVYFIISPSSKDVDVDFFLSQPLGQKLILKVTTEEGCYKIFNSNQDKSILKDNDTLVYLDKEGERTANTISNASGHTLNLLSLSSLK